MERIFHEARQTLMVFVFASCLLVGLSAAVFYTIGPEGWLSARFLAVLQDPSLATLAGFLALIGLIALAKRLLDRHKNAAFFSNLLVLVIGLSGLFIIVQALRNHLA